MRAKKDAAAKFKSMAAKARVLKHYRAKIVKCIGQSIKDNFEEACAHYENDMSAFLDSLTWMYQDLLKIESDVVPCFPASWGIYATYIREYHKTLNETIKKLLAAGPETSALLTLHAWLKEYKKNMKELEVPPELLQPPLLDGKEQTLIEDYLNLIVQKLDEWSANLMKTETETFTTRTDPLEVDGEGLYGTQGTVILFQMVNQQVDLAMESGQGAILARVVTDIDRVMRGIQDQWTKVIEAEFKKQMEKPEEAPPGLVEYCIALANDQIKSADYAEALSSRIEPLVSEKYRVTIIERLNDAIDGSLDVAKKCTQTLIDVIFNDLRPATKQLFQPAWYDGILRQIIETMRDYIADYQTFLSPSLFEVLIEDLLDAYLVTYLTALANCPKLRLPAAADRMKDDVSEAFRFFSAYKKSKDLEADFEVVEMILSLLEASKSMVFLSYWPFAKVHGPNIVFVEGLMKARGDLDRTAVGEVMDSIKRKVKEENITDRAFSFLFSLFVVLILRVFSARAYDYEEDLHPGEILQVPPFVVSSIVLLSVAVISRSNCISNSCSSVAYILTRTFTYFYNMVSFLLFPLAQFYSVLVLSCPGFLWLLSGSAAATWSIFLNCQGNLEGYKKGRRSNPSRLNDQQCTNNNRNRSISLLSSGL